MRSSVTLGYMKLDGSLAVLATLQNNENAMPQKQFEYFIENVAEMLSSRTGYTIHILEQRNSPQYVAVGGMNESCDC